MKVAIIGAGLSGMACAHEFRRNGITPTIFEKKGYIGEVLEIPAILLNMFNTPIKDPLKYVREKFGIFITPHFNLNEIIMVSPSNTYEVKGEMGSIFLRGRKEGYLTKQLEHALEILDMPFTLSTFGEIGKLKNEYDYVVVADGQPEISQQMGLFTPHFDAYVRIANVLGEFNTSSVKIWLNNKYAKHGYAYLVPDSTKEARLILIVDKIKEEELDYYWEEFLMTEKIPYRIIETRQIHHVVGNVFPVQVENIYFVGNAGGFIDSMLGFGSMNAIISGATAAECIIKGLDYNNAMQEFTKDIKDKYEFRKVFNTFDNKGMDLFIAAENFPGIKQFIFNNPLLKISYGSFIAKAFNAITNENQTQDES